MTAVEKPPVRTFLRIQSDSDPIDWRKEGEPMCTMACWHDRYILGDEQPDAEPVDWMRGLLDDQGDDAVEEFEENYPEFHGGYGTKEYWSFFNEYDQNKWELVREHFDRLYLSKPLYLYDHSGITISTGRFSCPWDSGLIGWIYVSREDLAKAYKDVPADEVIERATAVMDGEVQAYDWYLQGQVWGFEIVDVRVCDLGHEHEEVTDSCWGFSGDEYEHVVPDMCDHWEDGLFSEDQLRKAWDDRV